MVMIKQEVVGGPYRLCGNKCIIKHSHTHSHTKISISNQGQISLHAGGLHMCQDGHGTRGTFR